MIARERFRPMTTLLEKKERQEELYQRLIAFLLPVIAFYFGFVAHGLWPFGNKHLLAYDLYHQYAPFLLELKRKILSGDGLFFSWSGGLGVNFYSFFTYYTASPFNIVTLLFPDTFITEAVTLLTLLKLGFSSLFFREFLTRSFRKDPSASVLSGFYALSAWVYAYSWNIMWLDTLVFFPLACLGLVELVRDRRPRRFVLALTLMLLTNYYTAFFACVFLFFYYFVLRCQFAPKKRSLLASLAAFARFAGYACLSALLAAITLWPTIKALAITSAAGDAFPRGFAFGQSALDMLARMTPLRAPQIMSGLPNIFAGLFVLLLIPAFFANRRRPLRVRVAYGLLLGFLLFSFQSKTLSFLWHGGHYPNSLDYRYAFVFILLTLAMAYQAMGDDLTLSRGAAVTSAVSVFVLLLAEQQFKQNDTLSHWRLWATSLFLILYLTVFARMRPVPGGRERVPGRGVFYIMSGRHQLSPRHRLASLAALKRKRIPAPEPATRTGLLRYRRAQSLLFLFLVAELLFQAFTAAVLYQQVAPLGDRSYYLDNHYAREVLQMTADLKEAHRGQPWRAEILPDTCVNDPFLFASNGMSLFASPFPQASIDFFSDLGYPTNGVNSFQYKESTIVMDSLLGIEYLIVRQDRIFDDRTRTEISRGEETRLLRNHHVLPFGFFATQEAAYLDEEWMPEEAPDVQNRLLSALSGSPGALAIDYFRPWEMEGCYVEQAYEPSTFRVIREAGDGDWAFLVYDVPRDGIYYIFWADESVGINYSNGFIGDHEFFQLGGSKKGIGDVGFLEAGSELHFRVSMPLDKAIDGTFRACVARLDQEAWRAARDRLASHPLILDHFSTNSFSGEITAPSKGYLFLPTTGNPGWTFRVDGLKTPGQTLRGSFILIPLEAGPHTISARFAPQGFFAGLSVSLASLAALAGTAFYRRLRRRGRQGPGLRLR
ncbi:MAG: YfhO family protein [Fastidiosipila sp.]|nr:YfhO family protein [Fastidiosipila sp.]